MDICAVDNYQKIIHHFYLRCKLSVKKKKKAKKYFRSQIVSKQYEMCLWFDYARTFVF